MIVVDASAIVAIIAKEPKHEFLLALLIANRDCGITPISYIEVVMALARHMPDAKQATDSFLREMDLRIISIGGEHSEWAAHAFLTYGKGRHAARLNLGDCFSYAASKALNAPLLYVGDDFAKTDIHAA